MTQPDVEGSGASRNVRRRLLAGHSSMLGNANVFSGAVELRLGTANTIRGRDTADINCVPIRKVFDRFRNMRTPYIEADCMTQPAIRKWSLSAIAEPYPTVYGRGAPTEISVRVCCTAGWLDVSVNAGGLLMSSGAPLPATGLTRSHAVPDGTALPTSQIFNRFRHIGAANRQSSKAKMLSPASDCLIQRPMLTVCLATFKTDSYGEKNVVKQRTANR
ncbi:hypothetical protein Tco_0960125 [Tanacetum coccineum]